MKKYVNGKICPICLNKAEISNNVQNLHFEIDVICTNCSNYNATDMAVGRIEELTIEQKVRLSESIRCKFNKGEKVKLTILNVNNYT